MTGMNLKKRSVRFLIPPETMGKLSYNNKYLKSNGSIFVIKMMALIATIIIIANNIASSFYRKKNSLREKCLYSEVFWSAFSLIQTEYERHSISLRIQSECAKMWTRVTPNTDFFNAAITLSDSRKKSSFHEWSHCVKSVHVRSYFLSIFR